MRRVYRLLLAGVLLSAADLPAPVGGIITLAAGTTYEVNGTVTLTECPMESLACSTTTIVPSSR